MGRWADNGRYVDNVSDIEDFRSTGLVPTEEQARLTPTEKTLNAVTVAAGVQTVFTQYPVNMDGFTDFGVVCIADTSHSYTVAVQSSPTGGVNEMSYTSSYSQAGVSATKSGSGTAHAQYLLIQINNADTVTHTYNLWTRKINK